MSNGLESRVRRMVVAGSSPALSAKSERPVSVMFDDLDLIADVLPDYALGRRRGLADEETERRARAALTWAINRIMSREGEQEPGSEARQE